MIAAACLAAAAVAVGVIAMHGDDWENGPVIEAGVYGSPDGGIVWPGGPSGEDTGGKEAQTGQRAGDAGGAHGPGAPPEPPVAVPSVWMLSSYLHEKGTRTWSYRVSACATDAAGELLPLLEKGGMSMVESGYLDLSGNAWGCVCKLPDDAGAVVVTLLPCSESDQGDAIEGRIVVHDAVELGKELR